MPFSCDTPAIGPDTLDAAAQGGVAVLAVEANRVLLVDKPRLVRRANEASIALVSIGAE